MKRLHSSLGLSFLTIPFLLLFFIVTTTTSCKKVEGCTDGNAKNYSAEAEEDDGSCTYEAKVLFYISEESYNDLIDLYIDADISITEVRISVDNVHKGTLNYFDYRSEPDCDDISDVIIVTADLGKEKTKVARFRIEVKLDGEWEEYVEDNGEFEAEGDDCDVIDLFQDI